MSLASFLLGSKSSGKKKAIDTELDALFRSQVCCVEHYQSTPDHLRLGCVRVDPERPRRREEEETETRRAYG